MKLEFVSRSAAETRQVGKLLGRHALPGDWLGLGGELGAGKTTLVQGLARGAGVPARSAVVSPTFVICNQYRGRLPVYHFDLYRLHSFDELLETGYAEMAEGDGLCAVEWYDRIRESLPPTDLTVDLALEDRSRRRLSFRARGRRAEEWLRHVKEVIDGGPGAGAAIA